MLPQKASCNDRARLLSICDFRKPGARPRHAAPSTILSRNLLTSMVTEVCLLPISSCRVGLYSVEPWEKPKSRVLGHMDLSGFSAVAMKSYKSLLAKAFWTSWSRYPSRWGVADEGGVTTGLSAGSSIGVDALLVSGGREITEGSTSMNELVPSK